MTIRFQNDPLLVPQVVEEHSSLQTIQVLLLSQETQ
jgi:hypothetical protein